MICVAALIVLSILSLFSLSYRKLAKEAFACVFRRVTLRPCNTDFGQRIKAKIVAKLLKTNSNLARFANVYFEAASWLFIILFFVSLAFTARTGYNLVRYKTCDPQNPQNCIFSDKECSPSLHCKPCLCGENEEKCQAPDFAPCGGEENCDCDKSCEANVDAGPD